MESPTLKLIMLKGPRVGETLVFKPEKTIRIGRIVKGNTLPIKDSGISTKHVTIEFDSGKWVITDLDSSNGTLLNDIKLPPLTPFDLRHGDSVKIGEDTSIKVDFEVVEADCDEENRLRRNPRRKVAAVENADQDTNTRRSRRLGSLKKEEDGAELDSVVEIPGPVKRTRGRAAGVQKNNGKDNETSSVSEAQGEGLKNVGQVVEDKGVRGGLRRGRPLKEKEIENVEVVGESKPRRGRLPRGVKEIETVEVVVECNPRRGRPPRGAKKMNNVVVDGSSDLQDIPNIDASQMSCVEKASVACPLLPKIEGMTISEANEGLKEKCNVQDERLHSEGISGLEENVSRNNSDLRNKPLEAAAIDASTGKDNIEGLTSEPRRESTSTSGAKESNVNVGDDVDLEKITLGEWLDFLEVYLPKQIINVTEEMIAEMEEKAKRFNEFMLQQKKDKAVS